MTFYAGTAAAAAAAATPKIGQWQTIDSDRCLPYRGGASANRNSPGKLALMFGVIDCLNPIVMIRCSQLGCYKNYMVLTAIALYVAFRRYHPTTIVTDKPLNLFSCIFHQNLDNVVL